MRTNRLAIRRWPAAGTAVVLLALAGAANAFADVTTIRDGNDVPGALDVRAASHSHAGTRVVHAISTFANWPIGLVGPRTPNLFALEIDTRGDTRPERVVLVFASGGHMVAGVFTSRGAFVGRARASRPNAHTVRVAIDRSRLGNPPGYRWRALSYFQGAGCGRGCLDRAPNRSRVLHDVTAPKILFPAPTIPADVGYDVSFSLSDTGGSGVGSWRLQHRTFGDADWTTVASGTGGGGKHPHHAATQGSNSEFRVTASDRQGNTTVSPIRVVSVPIDDGAFAYSGWSASGGSGAFLGTLHVASDDERPDTATYGPFSGTSVSVVSPVGLTWINSRGDVYVDDVFVGSYQPGNVDAEAARRVVFTANGLDPGVPHTVKIVDAAGGQLPLDGIIVR